LQLLKKHLGFSFLALLFALSTIWRTLCPFFTPPPNLVLPFHSPHHPKNGDGTACERYPGQHAPEKRF